jgi:hypothetical protein
MRSISPFTRAAIELMCPLVFSVTGLLVDGAVLVSCGDHLAPACALVACAPALAAIAALKVAGDDRLDLGSGNHFGRR